MMCKKEMWGFIYVNSVCVISLSHILCWCNSGCYTCYFCRLREAVEIEIRVLSLTQAKIWLKNSLRLWAELLFGLDVWTKRYVICTPKKVETSNTSSLFFFFPSFISLNFIFLYNFFLSSLSGYPKVTTYPAV